MMFLNRIYYKTCFNVPNDISFYLNFLSFGISHFPLYVFFVFEFDSVKFDPIK